MTQRERMIKTLNHELPDRIPTTISARNEVIRALCEYFDDDVSGVYKRLGIETGASIGFEIRFNPDFDMKVNGVLTGDCPYAGGSSYSTRRIPSRTDGGLSVGRGEMGNMWSGSQDRL